MYNKKNTHQNLGDNSVRIKTDIISCNYDQRPTNTTLQYIILHYTEVEEQEALRLLTTKAGNVSAHYLISTNGEVRELVPPSYRAWHAGKSYWRGSTNLNDCSIGIEIVNNGKEEFRREQIEALLQLLEYLCANYKIARTNILGHSDIATARKIDPGLFFPWELLAAYNFGEWYKIDQPVTSEFLLTYDTTGAKVLKMQNLLAQYGYLISQTGVFNEETNYVIRAFLSHFQRHYLIKSIGIKQYWTDQTKYSWDTYSQTILEALIKEQNQLQ